MFNVGSSAGLKAALFDLDGLLVDSEPLWHEAEIRVLRPLGVPLTVELCRETKGRYVSEAVLHWQARYPWESPDLDTVVTDILDAVDELVASSLELKPGARHAISACQERKLRLAVASSAPIRIIQASLRKFGLEDDFEFICSAEDEAEGKPNPAVFLTAARLLDAHPGNCLVLEDSLAGIRAAKSAGMLCIGVPEVHAPPPPASVPGAYADVVLGSLEELDDEVWAQLQIGIGSKVTVVASHRGSDRPPITVGPGDVLTVGERDDQWPAFVLVTTESGRAGWVPLAALTTTGRPGDGHFTVRSGMAYDTTELDVDPETMLQVVETDLGSGWIWCADEADGQGWVPTRCVRPI